MCAAGGHKPLKVTPTAWALNLNTSTRTFTAARCKSPNSCLGRKSYGTSWTTTSTSLKTKPSGLGQTLSLKLQGGLTKQKFTLRMWGLCLDMSATVFAQTHGG